MSDLEWYCSECRGWVLADNEHAHQPPRYPVLSRYVEPHGDPTLGATAYAKTRAVVLEWLIVTAAFLG